MRKTQGLPQHRLIFPAELLDNPKRENVFVLLRHFNRAKVSALDQMLGISTMVLYPVAKPVKALTVGYINYTQVSAQVKHSLQFK